MPIAAALTDTDPLGAINARPPMFASALARARLAHSMARAIVWARPAATIWSVPPSGAEATPLHARAGAGAATRAELQVARRACPTLVATAHFVGTALSVAGATTRASRLRAVWALPARSAHTLTGREIILPVYAAGTAENAAAVRTSVTTIAEAAAIHAHPMPRAVRRAAVRCAAGAGPAFTAFAGPPEVVALTVAAAPIGAF